MCFCDYLLCNFYQEKIINLECIIYTLSWKRLCSYVMPYLNHPWVTILVFWYLICEGNLCAIFSKIETIPDKNFWEKKNVKKNKSLPPKRSLDILLWLLWCLQNSTVAQDGAKRLFQKSLFVKVQEDLFSFFLKIQTIVDIIYWDKSEK